MIVPQKLHVETPKKSRLISPHGIEIIGTIETITGIALINPDTVTAGNSQ
jgi:hypothetical protein